MKPQFSLLTLLIGTGAIARWTLIVVNVGKSPGLGGGAKGYVLTLFVLCGVTAAVHRLLPKKQTRLALAAILAAFVVIATLTLVMISELSG
jgi:hypothetical protein